MINVLAVYEKGVLRPKEPLALAEGETVSITVTPAPPAVSAEEWDKRIRAAKTIQEWAALANACPNPDPGYDVVAEMNESRRQTGFRLPDPTPSDGEPG
jgi:predicted DNA-binding antitoxin AbrB/MazE fold protein